MLEWRQTPAASTNKGSTTSRHARTVLETAREGTGGEFMSSDKANLCTGTPHGLKITTEGTQQYLYHANNAQLLAKTTLEGEIVWIKNGPFGQNM